MIQLITGAKSPGPRSHAQTRKSLHIMGALGASLTYSLMPTCRSASATAGRSVMHYSFASNRIRSESTYKQARGEPQAA